MKIGRNALVRTPLVLVTAVLSAFLAGCSAGVTGLSLLIYDLSTEPKDDPSPQTSVSSISPRVGAVIGGYKVAITGKDFGKAALASVGGNGVDPVNGFKVISRKGRTVTAEVTIPFNPVPEPFEDNIHAYLEWSDFKWRYTVSGLPSALRLSDHGDSEIQFWYFEPRLRRVEGSEDIQGPATGPGGTQQFGDINVFGDLGEVRQLRLEGDYFGFARDDSHTRVYLLSRHVRDQDGHQQLVVEIPKWDREKSRPYFWRSETSDQESDPTEAAHQGRRLVLWMPTQSEPDLRSPLGSGPDYLLRVVNENGVDDIEIGYAPPYPPRSLTCVEAEDGEDTAVKISWSFTSETAGGNLKTSQENQNSTAFDSIHIERFDPLREDWISVDFVDGTQTEYVARTTEFTNHTYRVYGEIDGEKSPALTCSLAVIPKGLFDLIWDLSAQDRVPGGSDMAEDGSGLLLQRFLEEAGRVTFLFRPERNSEALPPNLREVLEAPQPRVRTIWITSGKKANLGSIDEKSIEAILRYCKNWGGKLCLEGQHIAAAIEENSALRAFVCCRFKNPSQFLGATGSTGEERPFAGLGSNLLRFQLAEDPLDVSLHDKDHVSHGLTWLPGVNARAVFFAIDASQERKDELLELPEEQIVIGGLSPGGDGAPAPKEFAAALLLSEASSSPDQCKCQGACNEKVLIAFLDLQGFGPEPGSTADAEEVRRMVFRRYLEVLEGTTEPSPYSTEVKDVEPRHAIWNSSATVTISGTHLEKALKVSFGTTPARSMVVEGSPPDGKLKVVAPTVPPCTVPLVLRLADDRDLVAGQFTFDAPTTSIAIDEVSPKKGSREGGTAVFIRGKGFTSPPDLQVYFGKQLAASLDYGTDPQGEGFVVVVSPPAPPGKTLPLTVSLEVVTSGGSAPSSFIYTDDSYVPPFPLKGPRIDSVDPESGPESEMDVTLRGDSFTPDTLVTLVPSCQDPEPGNPDAPGEIPIQTVNVVHLGEIELRVPASCKGAWHFKVKNLMGSACSERAYEYLAPKVTKIEVAASGSVSEPGQDGTEPEGPFLVRGPRRGFEMTLTGMRFTRQTKVWICGEDAGELKLDPPGAQFPEAISFEVLPGTGTCEVAIQNFIGQDACARETVAQVTYVGRVLFLGQFSFDFGDKDPDRGGSNFKAYLESLADYEHSFLDDPGEGLITAGLLDSYDAVVFFKLPGRNLTPAEAESLRDFVKGGGGLVLLGQHGIVNPGIIGLLDAGDADDRNKILEGSGISFKPDLFCDRSSHILFNGCWTPQQGCVQVGATDDERPPLVGDKDNGVEYPVLRPNPASPHAILQDLEAVLFPWGQTLTVANPKEPNLWALYGSPESWGADSEDVLYSPGDLLCGPWFENGLPQGEEPKGVAGLVALEQGQGRIVAVGDQDMFTNHYFVPTFCIEQGGVASLLQSELFFKNILDWVTGQTGQKQE